MNIDSSLLSEAVVIWTGWSVTQRPLREEARLVQKYGSELTAELLPQLRRLEDSFYASDARFTVADLNTMGDVAASHFRVRHPGISEDAVRALKWCYTYDFR